MGRAARLCGAAAGMLCAAAAAAGDAATAPAPGGHGINGGLVLHLSLDGPGGRAADGSGRGNHGRVLQAKHTQEGRTGGAYVLDGNNDRIEVANSRSLELREQVTLAIWFKLLSFNPKGYANEAGYIINKGKDLWWNPTYCLGYSKGGGGALFHVCNATDPQRGGGCTVSSATKLQPNKWRHLAGTYDGKVVRIYVDGKLEASKPYTGPLRADGAPVLLGGGKLFGTDWGNQFTVHGVIDEAMIFGRALSAAEVAWIAGAGPAAGPPLTRLADADRLVLRSGDALVGTIRGDGYVVAASFGKVSLPAEVVVGMVAADGEGVRVVLADGQVVAGVLAGGAVRLELSGGALLRVPAGKVRELAYRVSDAKPATPRRSGCSVVLEGGEELAWERAETPLALRTDWGDVPLAGEAVLSVRAADAAGRTHRARLANGSVLAGLLLPETLRLKLRLGPTLTIERGRVRWLLWPGKPVRPPAAAVVMLTDGGRLFGRLADERLTIRTASQPVSLPPAEALTVTAAEGGTVQVTTWTGRALKGVPAEAAWAIALLPGGPVLKVPPGRIASIDRSGCSAPADLERRIAEAVARLGDNSFRVREEATAALTAMGPGIADLLRKHERHGDPEVRARIGMILRKLGG